jgi:peptidoglycan/LPS O-acetylase OafA/YrhL
VKSFLEDNSIENNSKARIAPVDGLRAIAVLGVIWAHNWMFFHNISLSIGKINSINLDLNRAISMLGTGVDLFFVISGFCMYLMYARKQSKFDLDSFFSFIKKRWLRIAPAFYVAALACALRYPLIGEPFPWRELLAHASFSQLWIPNPIDLAPPFWSLATEWHFYLFLPLFIWATSRYEFKTVIIITILSSIIFRFWMFSSPPDIEIIWKPQLPSRLVEFAWGIWVARLYTLNIKLPKILSKEIGFLIAFLIAYIGRLLMITEVANLAGSFGYICKTFAEPILTLGYALILWNVIASKSIFQKLFNHDLLQKLGIWSYALYLWHWYPCGWIAEFTIGKFGSSPLTQNIAFLISLILLIPFCYLSYSCLEAPYFRNPIRKTL